MATDILLKAFSADFISLLGQMIIPFAYENQTNALPLIAHSWKWTAECEESFCNSKTLLLTDKNILVHYNTKKPL